MQQTLASQDGPAVQLPLMVVAEVQDSLLVVMHDLQRLEGLLDHASENLLERFDLAHERLDGVALKPGLDGLLDEAREALRQAVTELQFHDMATQLINHTRGILQNCAFRLAAETMGREEGEEATPYVQPAPERPNPVTQGEMDAGSIELF
ncbi:hypothetical protein [Xylophilus sp. ASV27]|uniref:hypothetical protein n=1 Tax=Xylophilus sp. ASV27 TaxID=2795129 RepID=UPI0018EBD62D|nr:hypothetical protein [Xylophilus sp. ASV27]